MAAVLDDYQRHDAGGEIDTVRALLHDLRQPLAAILLLAGTEGGDVGRKMEGIAGQARWLADLVETVLSDAAGETGQVTVGISTDCAGVHLTVADNGPGLGYVASRTSLGLTTTRAMVAACNGSFELHAGSDAGAVADICLAEAGLQSVAS